jgi:predicted nucleic acid-binding protein
MTVYLPDTNVLVDALNGKRERRELLRDLVLAGNRLACCDITVAEIYAGMRPHEAARTDALLDSLAWYDSSRKVARRVASPVRPEPAAARGWLPGAARERATACPCFA